MANQNFSERFGLHEVDAEITIREDAPDDVRHAILMLGYDAIPSQEAMRELICKVLLIAPNLNNWGDEYIKEEIYTLINEAPWFKIYDFAEKLYEKISFDKKDRYEKQLNQRFRELGVGWELKGGSFVARGSEPFAHVTNNAIQIMYKTGSQTAANEIHEALKDISRRPADITGAIQHAMAALECVSRKVDNSKDTLGSIISRLNLPQPLDSALHKLWGFASNRGRHINEGEEPRFEEAELTVTIAAAVSSYLLHRPNIVK